MERSIPESDMVDPNPSAPRMATSPDRQAWRRFRRNRPAAAGAVVLLGLMVLALAWPLARHARFADRLPRAMAWSPLELSEAQFAPPTFAHWFGTDVHGRDLLSRVMYGTRISMWVGMTGAVVSLIIGVSWGAVAGYRGGRWDGFLMRTVDILYSLPSIVFVIVLVSLFEEPLRGGLTRAFGPESAPMANLLLLMLGLGAVSWLTMARIVRGQVLSLTTRAFVEASRALGARPGHVLRWHILPNLWGIVIVYLTLTIPSVILYESFLSYLGLGVQPPYASLGYLIADGAGHLNALRTHWWLIVFPGGTLALALLALSFVGDGLRDAWDPT